MDKDFLNVSFEVKSEDIKEDGTFRGWGSLFDKTPDAHGDLVARGAFAESLARGGRNRTGIPMLWQHRPAEIPGVWASLLEDRKGLDARGKLALKTQLGHDVYEIMKLGAELGTFRLGLSIGYDPIDFSIDKRTKVRTLKVVEIWELSLCTFPAKIGAGVVDLKTINSITTVRDLEHMLRNTGLSKTESLYVVSMCKPSLMAGGLESILTSLKAING